LLAGVNGTIVDAAFDVTGLTAGNAAHVVTDMVIPHGTRQIGGIAGTNTVTGIITGCTVNGSVYGDHFVGGMAG
ncbi:hypothetical protein H6B10_17125, partial [Gemmiger formicilis]|uniref:hypothetical protein n=1 Tax=Gemmiger formicilis TaxID=745368 RepID=UPI001958AAB7